MILETNTVFLKTTENVTKHRDIKERRRDLDI